MDILLGDEQTQLDLREPLEFDALVWTSYGFVERDGTSFLSSLTISAGGWTQVGFGTERGWLVSCMQLHVWLGYICTSCLPFAGADSHSQWNTTEFSSVWLDIKGPIPDVYTYKEDSWLFTHGAHREGDHWTVYSGDTSLTEVTGQISPFPGRGNGVLPLCFYTMWPSIF